MSTLFERNAPIDLPSCDDHHPGVILEGRCAWGCGCLSVFDSFEQPGHDILRILLTIPGLHDVSRREIWIKNPCAYLVLFANLTSAKREEVRVPSSSAGNGPQDIQQPRHSAHYA
jgi:hypothetical protein